MCYQPDVCPVGAIYSEEDVPDGTPASKYNADDPHTGHDHRYFIELSRNVFADRPAWVRRIAYHQRNQ